MYCSPVVYHWSTVDDSSPCLMYLVPAVFASVSPPDPSVGQVCGEQLRRFFHEESEEWHLRDCIRVEGKAYHPGCFEDHKVSHLFRG